MCEETKEKKVVIVQLDSMVMGVYSSRREAVEYAIGTMITAGRKPDQSVDEILHQMYNGKHYIEIRSEDNPDFVFKLMRVVLR